MCKLDPEKQITQKHKENQGGGLRPQRDGPPSVAQPLVDTLIFRVFPCILRFGVEFTYKNRHIISGKHAQELYTDFHVGH